MQRFKKLLKEYRDTGTYDALLCFSGGKDSTCTLWLLRKKLGLRVLAVTFDNGFLPEQTFKNIRIIAEKLDFDHILFKPRLELLSKIFGECSQKNIFSPNTLMWASSICTACISIVKFGALRIALEKKYSIHYVWVVSRSKPDYLCDHEK